MAGKSRLDALLVSRGHAETRSRAQALIISGIVFSGERRLDKPGHQVAEDIDIELRGSKLPFVSRGGLKLDHGLSHFEIDPAGMICIDVGSSTGGFTDVLLQNKADHVYAVDVGRGQLDWKLRNDDRVTVLEGMNARYLTSDQIPEAPALIVCDASFIGLRTVLPAAMGLSAEDAQMIALIKPQFEVGKGRVGKGGVVRDEALHKEVCETIEDWLSADCGWQVLGITESPIKGPKGNTEFLIAARKQAHAS